MIVVVVRGLSRVHVAQSIRFKAVNCQSVLYVIVVLIAKSVPCFCCFFIHGIGITELWLRTVAVIINKECRVVTTVTACATLIASIILKQNVANDNY